jgi:hypothetical protein
MANVPITKFAANAASNANASPGIAKLIGFQLSAFGGGQAVVELVSGPQHYNPMGTVHGGVLCDRGPPARAWYSAEKWRKGANEVHALRWKELPVRLGPFVHLNASRTISTRTAANY